MMTIMNEFMRMR